MTTNDKKYRVPIEMDKEYAAQIGIDPSEITYIMLAGKRTPVYFVEIEDEQLYHELMRPIWKEEKALQRSKKCAIGNEDGKLVRCDGNCAACPHTQAGTPISLDGMEATGGFRNTQDGVHRQQDAATYSASTADIVEDAMLLEALWHHIGELSEENQTIVTMFSEGASEREIAEVVGMSQKGVNKRKKAIFEAMKNNLKDFSEIGTQNGIKCPIACEEVRNHERQDQRTDRHPAGNQRGGKETGDKSGKGGKEKWKQ